MERIEAIVFRIIGTIINEWLPFEMDVVNLITLKLLNNDQIISIESNEEKDISRFSKFRKLKTIYMDSFTGSLEPLKGAPIRTIHMDSFTGSLEPLKGAPIRTI